ncbi:PTS glucose transporter subunit IIA [Raineyella sp. LH-20]|uniref:PTS sugar transporter subunit IIA n=1 Tax=Raineyella sp. LH-20 TaxID=3081204 RepID=UPI002954C973|nr:PTS glucose transporter subunit IIA [Raineyella sp. LH-20]WOP19704.1 PTS glucose transporter subunit IIA [Raineyella sp. LH-20]
MKVVAPVPGTVGPLSEAPDPVFAAEMVGSGVLIDPDRTPGIAVAPVSGKIAKVHPHAYAIATPDGLGLLVHLGIDTVKLDGAGFEIVGPVKGEVVAGQEMIRWDPTDVEARGLSPVVLVCVLDTAPGSIASDLLGQHVTTGEPLFDAPEGTARRGRRASS